MKSGISVCALAHETGVSPFGERGLELFLEHVRAHAEEVILVDTSNDGSVSTQFQSRYANVNVLRSPHSRQPLDLSQERNYSLEHATHQWILVLDPDERIQHWQALRDVIARDEDIPYLLSGDLVFHPDEHLPTLKRRQGETHMHRFFQNGQEYSFAGNIFEHAEKNIGQAQSPRIWKVTTPLSIDCGWEHHQTITQRLEHAERYARITGVYDPLPSLARDIGTTWETIRKRFG